MNTTTTARESIFTVALPHTLTFKYKGVIDFDNILKLFKWNCKNNSVILDARQCKMADYYLS